MITKANGAGMSVGAVAILLITMIIFPQLELLNQADAKINETSNQQEISIALNTEKIMKMSDLHEKIDDINISMTKVLCKLEIEC